MKIALIENRMKPLLRLIIALGLLSAHSGCRQEGGTVEQVETDPKPTISQSDSVDPESASIRFSNQTISSGVSFAYRNGEEAGHFSILESLGGGVGAVDLDRDGRDDLFFSGGGSLSQTAQPLGLPSAFFRNRQSWQFDNVSEISRIAQASCYSHGVAINDCDNDGFPDIVVTGFGGLQLLKNLGDGTFVDIAVEASLEDKQWSSSAAWGDFNGDGTVDLYVAHYVDWSPENHPFCKSPNPNQREICPPRQFRGLNDSLYLSNSDGTFQDVSATSGLSAEGKGLGVCVADLDEDGDADIYVTNDTVENFLYENVGGTFRDVSLLSGASVSERGVPEGSMGVDAFDYNRDGRLDLWVVNYENESAALYESSGALQFRHVSQRTGVTAAGAGLFVGWGTCAFDMDLNGFEDTFVSNGHVIRFPVNAPLRQKPLLLENVAGQRFRNVAQGAGDFFQTDHQGRGAATADFDGDGRLDIAISMNNEPAVLLQNETSSEGNWLSVELIGTVSSRIPIGAIVTLSDGSVALKRHLKGGGSYGSTNSPRLHFGVPEEFIPKTLSIRWPSGLTHTLEKPELGRLLRVIELPDQIRSF